MSVFLPDNPALAAQLEAGNKLLTVCYCAAWCDTCKQYLPKLQELAAKQPDVVFVWVDIEDYPELLDDQDVENFPTILLEKEGKSLFFGTILPHIGQLERLIEAMADKDDPFEGDSPKNVRALLLEALG